MAAASHAPSTPLLSGIYAIVNEAGDPVGLTRAILAAGVRIVQYRAKGGIVPAHARELRDLTRSHGALLLLNDAWREVETYGADGAHVGPDDARSLEPVRAALQGRTLGVSCGTADEARRALAAGADYLGVGSVYATASKADAGTPIGIEGLQRVAAATPLPVAAIGGITLARLPEIRRAGVAMAAVLSALSDAKQPQTAAGAFVRAWETR